MIPKVELSGIRGAFGTVKVSPGLSVVAGATVGVLFGVGTFGVEFNILGSLLDVPVLVAADVPKIFGTGISFYY